MISARIVLAQFPLLAFVSLAACGGKTLAVEPGDVEPGRGEDTAPSPALGVTPAPGWQSSHGSDGGEPPRGRDAGPSATIDATPVILTGGDSGSPLPPVDATTGACASDADCSADTMCSWGATEGMCMVSQNPLGACIPRGPLCNSIPMTAIACGCDGQDVTWEYGCNGVLPQYVPQGVAHGGACADAAVPALSCFADEECPAGLVCGYSIGLACNATGTCMPPGDLAGPCACDGVPVCACDGTTEYISCCTEYASKPVAAKGVCKDAGE
jgi:hypothetical protein